MSQGGLLSVHEAKYHGVPLVVLPLYGDQPRNAWAVDEGGYGVHLPWEDVTEESFRESVLSRMQSFMYCLLEFCLSIVCIFVSLNS